MAYSVETEIAVIKESLQSLDERTAHIEELIRGYASAATAALQRHEDQDIHRFDQMWSELGKVKNKVAYYGGGIAVLVALAELFLKP